MNAVTLNPPQNLARDEDRLTTRSDSEPTRDDAEAAVKILLRFLGENPSREGLADTPKRFVKAFEEYLAGYVVDPIALLQRSFGETDGYSDPVCLYDIRFTSHCEHHIAPITGVAHVAYIPRDRVVGISKLARVVECFARRLQIQERMTRQIADAIETALEPAGVAVVIEAHHGCMSARGVRSPDSTMRTTSFFGRYEADETLRRAFLDGIGRGGSF